MDLFALSLTGQACTRAVQEACATLQRSNTSFDPPMTHITSSTEISFSTPAPKMTAGMLNGNNRFVLAMQNFSANRLSQLKTGSVQSALEPRKIDA